MRQVVGSTLVVIGNIWSAIAGCGIAIVGILLWLSIIIWVFSWGGILFAILWLIFGGGIVGLIVGVSSLPIRLLGAGIIVLGEELKNPEPVVDLSDDCRECGQARVSEDDVYCRSCGQPYG